MFSAIIQLLPNRLFKVVHVRLVHPCLLEDVVNKVLILPIFRLLIVPIATLHRTFDSLVCLAVVSTENVMFAHKNPLVERVYKD